MHVSLEKLQTPFPVTRTTPLHIQLLARFLVALSVRTHSTNQKKYNDCTKPDIHKILRCVKFPPSENLVRHSDNLLDSKNSLISEINYEDAKMQTHLAITI